MSEQKFVQPRKAPRPYLPYGQGAPAVWANFCPSKPRLPSFIGGKKQVGQPLPGNLGSKNNLKEAPVMFLDWMLAGSFVLDLVAALAVRASVRWPTLRHGIRLLPPAVCRLLSPVDLPPTTEPLPVNFFSIKSIVVLIYPRTAEPLPPLPPVLHGQAAFFVHP